MARHFDLIAFDVDGTLVRHAEGLTVWEVLNRRLLGDAGLNVERYARYRSGTISYAEWVDLDVGGWRDAGATRSDLVAAFDELQPIDGALETLQTLSASGHRLVVISGTLDLMLHTLLPGHPFDEVYANHIGFDESDAISHWRATPFDMEGKAQLLRAIRMREGIPRERCAFVGDSTNDVWIAQEAGQAIALNPRSAELESVAQAVIRSDNLGSILPHLLPHASSDDE